MTQRLEQVAERAEKRDWKWGGITMVGFIVMAFLSYKVHVLQSTLNLLGLGE